MMTKEQNDIVKAEEFGRLPLREHIRFYQQGDSSKLQELLIQSPVEGFEEETQLGFTDYFLNNQLQKMKNKYNGFIAYDEIESMFLWILFHHNNKTNEPNGLFDRVDLEKMNSNRMMNYIAVSIDGYFKTHLESLRTFDDKVISEDAIELEDTEEGDDFQDTSLFNQATFQGWVEVSPPKTPTYERFLNEVGGLHAILSEFQLNVFNSTEAGNTQQQTADALRVSKHSVKYAVQQIKRRISGAFVDWRTIELLEDGQLQSLSEIVRNFLKTMESIAINDTTNSYDYFSHVIMFLKENTDKKEFQLDVEELSKNKLDVGQTVLSEILDNLHKSQYELVSNILRDFIEKPNQEAQEKYSDRSRTRFTLAIIRALRETTGKIEGRATNCLQLIVDNLGSRTLDSNGDFIQENAKYNEIVDVLKEPKKRKKKLVKKEINKREGY